MSRVPLVLRLRHGNVVVKNHLQKDLKRQYVRTSSGIAVLASRPVPITPVHLSNLSHLWLSDLQGDEKAPWALAPARNQSLRLCRGEKLHAEGSVAPIGLVGALRLKFRSCVFSPAHIPPQTRMIFMGSCGRIFFCSSCSLRFWI